MNKEANSYLETSHKVQRIALASDEKQDIDRNMSIKDIVNRVKKIMIAKDAIYIRGSKLVGLVNDCAVHELNFETLAARLSDYAEWVDTDGVNRKIKTPNKMALKAFLDDPCYWDGIPEIKGILHRPFMTIDGKLVGLNRGYDKTTQYLFSRNSQDIEDMVNDMTEEQALTYLYEPLKEFPTNTFPKVLSMLYGMIMRPALNAIPLFIFNSKQTGTGKTTLAKIISTIGDGTVPSVKPFNSDSNEVDKEVKAFLAGGENVCLFDEVRNLFSMTLSAALTSSDSTFKFRPFKSNTTEVSVDLSLRTFVMTGRSVNVGDDFIRRTIWIEVDHGLENHSRRDTTRNIDELTKYVNENKDVLMAAAVKLYRCFSSQFERTKLTKMNNFDCWVDNCGTAAVYVAKKIHLEKIGSLLGDQDYDITYQDGTTMVMLEDESFARLLEKIYQRQGPTGYNVSEIYEEFPNELEESIGKERVVDARKRGRAISDKSDQFFGGYCLRKREYKGKTKASGRYYVERSKFAETTSDD